MGSLFGHGLHLLFTLCGPYVRSRVRLGGRSSCEPLCSRAWFRLVGWVVVVGGLVGGGSRACRVPVTQVALCERRAGALSERKKAPNPINS